MPKASPLLDPHPPPPAHPPPPQTSIWETEVLVNTPLGRLQIITPLLGRAAAYNVVAGAPRAARVPCHLHVSLPR